MRTLLLLPLMACVPSEPLAPWKVEMLRTEFSMDGVEVPPARDNAWGDDPLAIELGRCLFHDTRLSEPVEGIDPVSCNTCHDIEHGGADPRGTPTSLMASGGYSSRQSPSLYNGAWRGTGVGWNWEGSKSEMWRQIQGPLQGHPHNSDPLEVSQRVLTFHGEQYEATFGAPPVLPAGPYEELSAAEDLVVMSVFDNVAKSLEAYSRTLVSQDSAFDRAVNGEPEAMSSAAWRGADVFIGDGFCNECHRGPAFSDQTLHNIGVSQANGPLVPSVDPGQGVFLTPGLRGVSRTAPYMHNGSVDSLWDVLEFYRFGGHASGYVGESEIRELHLTDEQLADLEAFLNALDGAPLMADHITGKGCP